MAVAGSANWDYRNLHSNYGTCIPIHDPDFVSKLEWMMHEDLRIGIPVDLNVFTCPPILPHYLENACGILTFLL